MVPQGEPGEDGEAVVGQGVAVDVADEPAAAGVALQPAEKRDNLVVGQVMGEVMMKSNFSAGW